MNRLSNPTRPPCACALAFALTLVVGCKGDDGFSQAPVCRDYLACAAKLQPVAYPTLLQNYGPKGACWNQTAEIAAQCESICRGELEVAQLLPDLPAECVPPPDMGTPKDAGVPTDAIRPPDLPQYTAGQPVDILLVIDNSGSMDQEQEALLTGIGSLIEGLRGKTGTLPSLRIGVISTDLGAGNYSLPSCEVTAGDRGKLQNAARVAGCTPPQDPWIQFEENASINVSGAQPTTTKLKSTVECIGRLGIQGCGFEHTLESARWALDEQINPGFLRPNAALLVVFITDEDDCSASKNALFDPQQQALSDPLGPLTSFRCFEFGIQCDVNDRNTVGPRSNCTPGYDWLRPIDGYVAFFASLKRPVAMGAIIGPVSPVVVGKDGSNPVLKPSCQTADGFGVPAIRIHTLVSAFNGVVGSICDLQSFAATLKATGQQFSK